MGNWGSAARKPSGTVEQKRAIGLHDVANKAFELKQEPGIGPFMPGRLRELLESGRGLASCRCGHQIVLRGVEKAVHRNVKGCCKSLQGLDGWHGVTVLDPRNVTAEHPSAPFNVAL